MKTWVGLPTGNDKERERERETKGGGEVISKDTSIILKPEKTVN